MLATVIYHNIHGVHPQFRVSTVILASPLHAATPAIWLSLAALHGWMPDGIREQHRIQCSLASEAAVVVRFPSARWAFGHWSGVISVRPSIILPFSPSALIVRPTTKARTKAIRPAQLECPAVPERTSCARQILCEGTSGPDRQMHYRLSLSLVCCRQESRPNKFGARRQYREPSTHRTVVIRATDVGNLMNYASAATASDCKFAAAAKLSNLWALYLFRIITAKLSDKYIVRRSCMLARDSDGKRWKTCTKTTKNRRATWYDTKRALKC